jgi:hypothetical protein
MDNDVFLSASVIATTHEHRPITIKRFYNDKYTAIIYCADCHTRLNSYVEQLSDENECPIGATDSTGIS